MNNVMSKRTLLISGVVVCLTANVINTANAGKEQSPGFYFQPAVDLHFFDDELDLKTRLGVGANLGYQYDNKWGVDFAYAQVGTETTSDIDVDVNYYSLNGTYNFAEIADIELIPFLQLGLGKVKYTYDTNPETDMDDTLVNVGVGVKYQISPSVLYTFDIQGMVGAEEKTVDAGYNLGIAYLLSAPPKVVAKPVVKTVEKPVERIVAVTTKKEVKVTPVIVPAVIVPPADGDKDGVFDDSDKCLDTKLGALVDATGCYIMLTESKDFTLDVKFKTGSSELDASTKGSIADLAKFLTSYAQTTVVIEGHTDSKGSAASNKALSQKRADSVRNSLINDFGTDAARVTALGYGLEKPIADNATEAGRAQNRRVVAKVQASIQVIKE